MSLVYPLKPAAFVIVPATYRSGQCSEWHAFESAEEAHAFAKVTEGADLIRVLDYVWHPVTKKEVAR